MKQKNPIKAFITIYNILLGKNFKYIFQYFNYKSIILYVTALDETVMNYRRYY